MTLAAITEHPTLWRAAVDVVGIANFVTFLELTGAYRRALREAEYGSLETHRAFLESISPLAKVDAHRHAAAGHPRRQRPARPGRGGRADRHGAARARPRGRVPALRGRGARPGAARQPARRLPEGRRLPGAAPPGVAQAERRPRSPATRRGGIRPGRKGGGREREGAARGEGRGGGRLRGGRLRRVRRPRSRPADGARRGSGERSGSAPGGKRARGGRLGGGAGTAGRRRARTALAEVGPGGVRPVPGGTDPYRTARPALAGAAACWVVPAIRKEVVVLTDESWRPCAVWASLVRGNRSGWYPAERPGAPPASTALRRMSITERSSRARLGARRCRSATGRSPSTSAPVTLPRLGASARDALRRGRPGGADRAR